MQINSATTEEANFPSLKIAVPAFVILITVAICAVSFVVNMVAVPTQRRTIPAVVLQDGTVKASGALSEAAQVQN